MPPPPQRKRLTWVSFDRINSVKNTVVHGPVPLAYLPSQRRTVILTIMAGNPSDDDELKDLLKEARELENADSSDYTAADATHPNRDKDRPK